jgi:hypothetical protein
VTGDCGGQVQGEACWGLVAEGSVGPCCVVVVDPGCHQLTTMSPAWDWGRGPRPGLARYHGTYRDLAAETGAGRIDTAPVWLALPEVERKCLFPDGGHPADEGMERITLPVFVSALKPFDCN